MLVKDFISYFDMLQEVEIYPTLSENNPDKSFLFEEEVDESIPLFQGEIKDIPYYILSCRIFTDLDPFIEEGPVDCRVKPGTARTMLVFNIIEPEGV